MLGLDIKGESNLLLSWIIYHLCHQRGDVSRGGNNCGRNIENDFFADNSGNHGNQQNNDLISQIYIFKEYEYSIKIFPSLVLINSFFCLFSWPRQTIVSGDFRLPSPSPSLPLRITYSRCEITFCVFRSMLV